MVKTKYQLLIDAILAKVEAGDLPPGSRLPAEDEFAREHNVSLGTAQKALRELADMGVLIRRHGNGTFVMDPSKLKQSGHFRFLAEDGTTVLPVTVTDVKVAIVTEAGPWARFLGEACDGYVRLLRHIDIGGEFAIFSELYLLAHRFGALLEGAEEDLRGSIRDVLFEKFNAPALRVKQSMLSQPLPPRATRELAIPAGSYGMIWTLETSSFRDAPLFWQRNFVPSSDRPLEVLNISELNKQSERLHSISGPKR